MNLKAVGKNHYKNLHGGVLPNEMSEKELTKLGRQLLTSGKCVPTDYGLLFENEEVPMREVYDGTVFPLYNRDDHYVALCSMESHGKKEYLHLPEEEITIKMAMGRLGASSLEDCSVKIENVSIDQEEWPEWLNRVLRDEGLGALNSLADVLIRNRLACDYGVEQLAGLIGSGYRIDLNQGMDARLVTPEVADILARLKWISYLRFSCDQESQIEPILRTCRLLKERGVKPYRVFVYLLVTADLGSASRRVEALKGLRGLHLYAQAERNESLGIRPNKAQLEFAQRYVYGGRFRRATWEEYFNTRGMIF